MRKPILVKGFKTQAALKAAVKAEIDPFMATGKEFESYLMQELLSKQHYGCVKYGVTPLRFKWTYKKLDRYGLTNERTCFNAFFDDPRYPQLDKKWRDISWNKAIRNFTAEENLDVAIKAWFREIIDPITNAYRRKHFKCEKCSASSDDLQLDHADPQFAEIADAAIALLSDVERKQMIDNYDWLKDTPLEVPKHCSDYVINIHKKAKFMVLCTGCHKQVTRERRGILS